MQNPDSKVQVTTKLQRATWKAMQEVASEDHRSLSAQVAVACAQQLRARGFRFDEDVGQWVRAAA